MIIISFEIFKVEKHLFIGYTHEHETCAPQEEGIWTEIFLP